MRASPTMPAIGWRRTRIDGTSGAQTRCAWGVLTHNATKINGLISADSAPESP
ncbi:MAG: hypothetical protein LC749_11940 [Actinobacteria bacterium]|nr:hypothetical protein [Actinomycetota bacterium]